MLEYLDKFGKTVSVVEWIVYLNNSLLASETSLFQTVREMTECSHLQRNSTVRGVRTPPAPSLLDRQGQGQPASTTPQRISPRSLFLQTKVEDGTYLLRQAFCLLL